MASPLEQFKVFPIVDLPPVAGYDVDFTNASLFMVIAAGLAALIPLLSVRQGALVPSRWQSMSEILYNMVASTVRDNVGEQGKPYFAFIFTLFMFVLFCNLVGMIPYSFTVTSHIIVTFVMAMAIFIGATIVAIIKHGLVAFIFRFVPEGTPLWMAPLMYVIELFSYLARPISLSVRLTANMMAGHTMLKVIAGFVVSLGSLGFFGLAGAVPLALLVVLTGFEIFVAILQAYIFTVLTCVYLNDALHHH